MNKYILQEGILSLYNSEFLYHVTNYKNVHASEFSCNNSGNDGHFMGQWSFLGDVN